MEIKKINRIKNNLHERIIRTRESLFDYDESIKSGEEFSFKFNLNLESVDEMTKVGY